MDSGQALDQAGIFWWDGNLIPSGHYAPPLSVAGQLRINAEGLAELELHGMLREIDEDKLLSVFQPQNQLEHRTICGILKSSGEHVRITKLHAGKSSYAMKGDMSHESYFGAKCLVTEKPSADSDVYAEVRLSLESFGDWVGMRKARFSNEDNAIKLQYEKKDTINHPTSGGMIVLTHDARMNQSETTSTLYEHSSLIYRPTEPKNIAELNSVFTNIFNMLIVVAGQPFSMPWPRFKGSNGTATLFYWRSKPPSESVAWTECALKFSNIRANLGSLYQDWIKAKDMAEASFNLYLATKRGKPLFTEHHFVTLVWALESLHRRQVSAIHGPQPLDKLQIIISKIENDEERAWMTNRFKNASEPALAQRLFELMSSLEFNFTSKSLRTFVDLCAKYRNDISHHGDLHSSGAESNTLIHPMISVLSGLLQSLILKMIGLNLNVIQDAFFRGHTRQFMEACEAVRLKRNPGSKPLK